MTPRRWAVTLAIVVAAIAAIVTAILFRPRPPAPIRARRTAEATQGVEPTGAVESTAATRTIDATTPPVGKRKEKPWKSSVPVVFVRSNSLWKIREDGRGYAKRVVPLEDGATYLLSPNRQKIAYTDPAGWHKSLLVEDTAARRNYVVAPDTSTFQGLPYAWSPEGYRLAYTVPTYSGPKRVREDLFVADRDGGNRRLLVKQAGAPVWSPGERIAFRRVDFSRGTWELWTIRPDGSGLAKVAQSKQATAYGWSSRQDDLAFAVTETSGGNPMSLVKVLRAGTKWPKAVLQERLNQANYTKLAWSPDGQQIAVDRSGDDGYSRVAVVGVAGDRPGWEVNAKRDNYLLGWSGDGSRLLYFEGNSFQGAPSNLWIVKRNGTSRRVVVTNAAVQ